ncbi:aldose 1-epimerase [Ranunculus cassubicifolius]
MKIIYLFVSLAIVVACMFVKVSVARLEHTPEVKFYELKKGNFSVKFTNRGATIVSVIVPDKTGKLADIVLGFDTVEEYADNSQYFGAIVGRVANRIGGAKFTLNGKTYKLNANEGNNTLHGGKPGYGDVVWRVSKYEKGGQSPYITFAYHSFDGEQRFPGDLSIHVTYKLLEYQKLSVIMKAKALNKATPVNIINHSYWNLRGHNTGDIFSNEIQLFASHVTTLDDSSIPTGEIAPVKGTPYDFLHSRVISSQINKLPFGYNINYVVDGPNDGKMKKVAVVHEGKSGRVMKLWSNAPGVQFYTSHWLNNIKGKGGYVYNSSAALCLETQGFPDAVNHPNFPSVIVNPGKTFKHYMLYQFSVK